MMKVPYYDISDRTPEDPDYIDVERIYCFDFSEFSEDDWDRLASVYAALPEQQESSKGPMWYGDEDSDSGFLWASVEPPGLQVAGVLTPQQWESWDEQFRNLTIGLPFRSVPWSQQ